MKQLSQPHALLIIICHELRALAREGTFAALLCIFFMVTVFSVFIGWSTRTTTDAIYSVTVSVLHAAGVASVAANPLAGVSALALFDNLLVYTLLVGALLAIVVGHRSFVRDRTSGVVPLMLSRPTGRRTYILGKLCGTYVSLLLVVTAMFVVSAVSALFIPALHLSGGEFLSLAGFYAISYVYLAFFATLGLFCAVVMRNESLALLVPVIVWIAVVFILPELSTGQNPVSLLNPVTLAQAPSTPGAFFSAMRSLLGPFSLGQDYTALALYFLHGASVSAFATAKLAGLFIAIAITGSASVYALERYSLVSDALA